MQENVRERCKNECGLGQFIMVKILNKLRNYFTDFEYGVYDAKKESVWVVQSQGKSLGYLKSQNADGRHIFIRPVKEQEPYFMLVDDLNSDQLESHKKGGEWKKGRLVVVTSPGNYQVWIRSARKLTNTEKSYWLKRMRSDPGAAPKGRYGRAPGFRNHKYSDHPLARLVWVDWKYDAEVPEIHPVIGELKTRGKKEGKRQGNRVVDTREIARADYETGDESRTDFRYVLALIRRGFTDAAIKGRLLSERTEWASHTGGRKKEDYLNRTIKKAREIAGTCGGE